MKGVSCGLFVVLVVEKTNNCRLSCFKLEKETKSRTKRFLLSPENVVIANAVLMLFLDRCLLLVLEEPCN